METTRRDFLLSAANAAVLSVLGAAVGFPILEIFLSHARVSPGTGDTVGFVPVARLSELMPGRPVQKAVTASQNDAWNRLENVNLGSVWLVQDEGGIRAYSSVCPHLGCLYGWNANDRVFVCPCHVSGFDLNGRVLKGPAPRPLDSLEVRTEGDRILVNYRRFLAGIPQKKAI